MPTKHWRAVKNILERCEERLTQGIEQEKEVVSEHWKSRRKDRPSAIRAGERGRRVSKSIKERLARHLLSKVTWTAANLNFFSIVSQWIVIDPVALSGFPLESLLGPQSELHWWKWESKSRISNWDSQCLYRRQQDGLIETDVWFTSAARSWKKIIKIFK